MTQQRMAHLAVTVGGTALGIGALVFMCASPADALWGKKKDSEAVAAPAVPTAPASDEKIAYTFEDDTKMQEFTRLWQQRQAIVLKMTVLQSYWREEEGALAQLNSKLTEDYKLDINKNYFLDSDRRVLIEREAPPAAASVPPAATTAPEPSAQ